MRTSLALFTIPCVLVAVPAHAQIINTVPVSATADDLTVVNPDALLSTATTVTSTDDQKQAGQGSDASIKTNEELPVGDSSAHAVTVYTNLKTAYVMNSIGRYAYDKPVIQSGVTVNFLTFKSGGGLWADFWNSTPVALTKRNLNSYAEESDFTIGVDKTIGGVEFTATVAYFALQPYHSTRDDVVQATLRAAVPIKFGKAITVRVYAEPYVWLGVPEFPTHKFVRFGVIPSATIFGCDVALDAAREQKLTRGQKAITPEHGVFRFELSGSKDLGNGWRFSTSLAKSGNLPVVASIGFSWTH